MDLEKLEDADLLNKLIDNPMIKVFLRNALIA